jgi:hypothetical protein
VSKTKLPESEISALSIIISFEIVYILSRSGMKDKYAVGAQTEVSIDNFPNIPGCECRFGESRAKNIKIQVDFLTIWLNNE